MIEAVKIPSGKWVLAGNLVRARNQKGGVLFIAGGGKQSMIYDDWQNFLADHGYSSLSFDFPGISKSTGNLHETGLASRIENTKDALSFLKESSDLQDSEISLVGRSMGGPIALRVGSNYRKLVLLFPAAYADGAYEKLFGDEFSKVIRAEKSWEGAQDFDFAGQIREKLMVLYGEQEHVIPEEIQKTYLDIALKPMRLKGVGHNRNLWEDSPESTSNRQKLFQEVLRFIEQ